MATVRQFAFSKGELAPSMYSRVDQAAYQVGLKTCRNYLVKKEGGVENRPGTQFVGEVKDSSKATRLIPFDAGDGATYAIEFGNLYARFHTSGATVTSTAQAISAITNANPGVLTYVGADNYANGDHVYVSGVVGPIGAYVNNRTFLVANVNAGANTFELDYLDGTNVNTTSWGLYTSGGTIAEIYTLGTAWTDSDVFGIDYAQEGENVTLVHPSYSPRYLKRASAASWSTSSILFAPFAGTAPKTYLEITTGTRGAAGTGVYKYQVTMRIVKSTYVDSDPAAEALYSESLPVGDENPTAITGITNANPAVVTCVGHGYSNGDDIYIASVSGMTEVNERRFSIAGVTANTFQLEGVNSSGYGAFTSALNPSLWRLYRSILACAAPTSQAPNVLTITNSIAASVAAIDEDSEWLYDFYREQNGVFSWIGSVNKVGRSAITFSFSDTGVSPDVTSQPPEEGPLFDETGEYPRAVSYFQQRRILAAPDDDLLRFDGSGLEEYANFAKRPIGTSDDAVSATADARGHSIKFVGVLGDLILFSSRGEFVVNKGSVEGLSRSNIRVTQEGYTGCSDVKPVSVNNSILFVDKGHSGVFDVGFQFESDGYVGNEISVFSSHLFRGHTIVDACIQKTPDPVAWFVRDDGVLLSCTYVKEHQVFGWARHDFENGLVESVCAIPEGENDALYLIVNRTIDGDTKRYVERLNDRFFNEEDIADCVFMDSALTYDGWNVGATTMTASLGTGWTTSDTQTMTASASYFTSGDVGNAIHLRSGSTVIRFLIVAYIGATSVTVTPSEDVPVAFRATAFTDWADAVDEVTGLWHLEGEDVSVFADGYVVASPNNPGYDTLTVTNGSITLDRPYAKIHVGLPITADMETLAVDTAGGQVIANRKKLNSKVYLQVEKTRGLFIGSEAPDDDGTDNLEEPKIRDEEEYNSSVDLLTGLCEAIVTSRWNFSGGAFVRQVDPVPATINSVMIAGNM